MTRRFHFFSDQLHYKGPQVMNDEYTNDGPLVSHTGMSLSTKFEAPGCFVLYKSI
jgi:hypothetical protein